MAFDFRFVRGTVSPSRHPRPLNPIFCRLWNVALRVLAGSLVVSIAFAAWHDVSQAWDSGYYHLPFAARLAGIVGPDALVFDVVDQARFQGFPLLGELLQGWLWRITGRIECANFVCVLSIPLFAWFLRRRFDVPLHLSTISLLAIPLVQTHATSCYVDLPANAAASIVVLLAIEAHATSRELTMKTLVLACVAATIAANMKALLHVIIAFALAAIALRLVRERSHSKMAALALFAPIIFLTPLKNLWLHGNPYFPLQLTFLGHPLAGIEPPYDSSPPWLAQAPRFVRFLCSVLEIGVRPLTDPRRWTVDQWMPQSSTGNRMGGFFGMYALANVGLLAWRAIRDREGPARRTALGFAGFTLLISLMPQSHELRYYLSWMIVLVSLNAWLACRADAVPFLLQRAMLETLATASLLIVIACTRANYVVASGSSLPELLRNKVDEHALETVANGSRVCVSREPYTLYYAAPFHPPRHYVVQEAEEPTDCAGAPMLGDSR
jgi:hypothetical protein